MLSANEAIDRLQVVPYVKSGGSLSGADCFGIVELWYKLVLGVDINERKSNECSHNGLNSGFVSATSSGRWERIDTPEDNCIVVMRGGPHAAGHVGIYHRGNILHSDEGHGCIYERANGRFIRSRITGYYRRTSGEQ